MSGEIKRYPERCKHLKVFYDFETAKQAAFRITQKQTDKTQMAEAYICHNCQKSHLRFIKKAYYAK